MAARVVKGAKQPLIEWKKGFNEYFLEKVEKFGDSVFQIDAITGEEQTYKQVLQRSIRVAISLQTLGVKPRDIVLLCCYNDLDNIVPWIASLFVGAISCSVGTEQEICDIDAVTAQIKPKAVFVVEEMLEVVENCLRKANSNPKIVVIGKSNIYPTMSDFEKNDTPEEKSFKPAKIDPYETAWIMLSSGTTTTPKGICLNQPRFMYYASMFEKHQKESSNLRMLQKSSLHWITAIFHTFQILAVGGSKIVAHKLSLSQFLETLSIYKVNSAMVTDGSVYALAELLEKTSSLDLSSLKKLLVGGAKVEKSVILKLRELLPGAMVFTVYGSTEIGGITSISYLQDPKLYGKANSIGKLIENVEIKIVDIETRQILPANKEGELFVKTPFIMNGYYNYKNPDNYDCEGFFKTGDLAYYDEDDYIYITDRINQTFKVLLDDYCFKIRPSLVEARLVEHPDVKESVVFGLPDEKCINLPAALVVLKNDAKSNVNDILEFVNTKVPHSYKLLAGVKVIDALPKTANDKIARKKCIKLFNEM